MKVLVLGNSITKHAPNISPGLANKDADVFLDNVTEGVLNHSGDLGMKVMAERIFAAADLSISAVTEK